MVINIIWHDNDDSVYPWCRRSGDDNDYDDVVFQFGGTRDSLLMNVDCSAGKHGRAMIFLTNM